MWETREISDFEIWKNDLVAKLSDRPTDIQCLQDITKMDFKQVQDEILTRLDSVRSGREKKACLELLGLLWGKYHYIEQIKRIYDNEIGKMSVLCESKIREIAWCCYEQGDFMTAAYAFRMLAEEGKITAKNNLAYMIRRKEAEGKTRPMIREAMELLCEGVKQREEFSLTNMALIFALNLGKESDWRTADDLMAAIPMNRVQDIWDWWMKLSKAGEAEGDLVLLWLLRHGKKRENSTGNVQELWKKLTEKIETVPKWLQETL